MQTKQPITVNDNFVEHLTHRAYFVQTKKIKQSLSTKLDALLSIFAQDDFASDDKTTKRFPVEQSIPEIKELLTVLQHAAADGEVRKELEKELYYQRYVEQTFGETNRKLAEKDAVISDKNAELADKDAKLADKDAKLADKDAKLADKDAKLADKDAENEALRLQIAELKAKLST